ncbi:MAG: DUF1566 domain-containing protein [Candidatus Pacebacteria bacterium]|nr:DUF1566 domain-containing protein [Candidatus Paceibacterota bacterium]
MAWPGFQDNGDTLTDLRTNLTWQKDALSSINNFGASTTQDNAVDFITGQNSDWRLPNFKELASLFSYALPNPGVWSGFLNIKPENYWSISKRMINAPTWGIPPRYSGWSFNFLNGIVENNIYDLGQDNNFYSFMATKNQGIPGGLSGDDDFDFTDNNDGTIKDNKTGLMWLNANLSHVMGNRKNWNSAFMLANNVALCNDGTLQGNENKAGDCLANGGVKYDDWRLPNVQELMEITKLDNQPGIPSILPNLSLGVSFYWTGTMFDANNVWYVGDGFCFGMVNYRAKIGEEFNVQLVREE